MIISRKLSSPVLLSVFFMSSLAAAAGESETISRSQARADEKSNVLWYDIRLLNIEGRGWDDTKEFYDRLPAKAEETVRDSVWRLSQDSAGMAVRFVTDATTISARWSLRSPSLAMNHMPATGVSGLDLYVKDDEGKWRWLAVGRPTQQANSATLVGGIPEGTREYFLYLPLYNGVTSVEIGIPKSSTLAKAPERPEGHRKPIVFYGTSITQGGCASRPGMVHTAILGRMLDHPVINLGFSGNGRMEMEVADLMAELDAAVYVIDCLPNIDAVAVKERTEPLVHRLRESHPETPILLVEDRSYSDSFLISSKKQRNETSRRELQAAFERLQKEGVKDIYYLEGEHLLGDDNEGTVDSSHPTDLGFLRQAQAFAESLRPILRKLNTSR